MCNTASLAGALLSALKKKKVIALGLKNSIQDLIKAYCEGLVRKCISLGRISAVSYKGKKRSIIFS